MKQQMNYSTVPCCLFWLILSAFMNGCTDKRSDITRAADTATESAGIPEGGFQKNRRDDSVGTFFRLPADITYDSLAPAKPFPYWEYRIQFSGDYVVLGSGGRFPHEFFRFEKVRTQNGFMSWYENVYSPEYIAVNDGSRNKVWDTKDELRLFLGRIDNIHEAMLVARLYGFIPNEKNRESGVYAVDGSGYVLFLAKEINDSPQTTMHRFRVHVNFDGTIESTEIGLQEPPGDSLLQGRQ